MYTAVTNDYIQAVSKHSRHFVAKMVFDINAKTFEGRDIYSIKYDGGSSNTEYLTLGSVLSACLTVEMFETTYKMANKYFHLYIGLELSDGSVEWIPQGRYKVIDVQTKAGKTTLQCQDKLIMSDLRYVSRISYPAKLSEILTEIGKKINVKFNYEDCVDYEIQSKPTGYTIREMLSMIAMMWGCFAVCNREGNVDFRWYVESGYTITLDRSEAPEIAEDTFSLDCLTCYYDGDNYYQQGNPEAAQGVIIENPYIDESKLATVYNKVKGFAYHAANIKCLLGDPRVDVWDLVNISNTTSTVTIPVMSYTWDFDGGFSSTITSTVETESETEYRTGTAAASRSAENSAGTTTYYVALSQDKSIGSMSANILSIDFAARESTIPVLGATIQLNLSVGGCVDFVLIFDNATFATFSENYTEGKCCKALSLPILGVGNGSHNLTIAIKSDTAKGTAQVPSAAYIMGSGLAENTAWNGTISVRQPYDNISIDNHRMTLAVISDNVTANAPKPIGLSIREQDLKWVINTNTISIRDITDTLPSNPIQAYNDGDNTIYIDFYNPIKSDDLEANISALEITTVINTTTTKIPILTLEQSQLHQLKITLSDLSITIGTVSIAYNGGNIRDYATGNKIEDFVIAFTPTSTIAEDGEESEESEEI